jgi:hypothetical protein
MTHLNNHLFLIVFIVFDSDRIAMAIRLMIQAIGYLGKDFSWCRLLSLYDQSMIGDVLVHAPPNLARRSAAAQAGVYSI